MALSATRLAFFDDSSMLDASATVVCHLEVCVLFPVFSLLRLHHSSHRSADRLFLVQEEGGRHAIVLDSTLFHPQGGGQPADTGFIAVSGHPGLKFIVEDVRSKDSGVVRIRSPLFFSLLDEAVRYLCIFSSSLTVFWVWFACHRLLGLTRNFFNDRISNA